MKQIIMYLMALTTIVIIGSSCKKQSNTNTDDNNLPGLPPATQSGANTLGFLLNGQPWVPSGNNGSGNNLSIDYDPGFNNGAFGIAAYRALGNVNSDNFGIGAWNLNSLIFPSIIDLKNNSISNAFYSVQSCWFTSQDMGVLKDGFFYIDVLDKQKRIIAGRFEFTVEINGCPTVRITKGRFDFKF